MSDIRVRKEHREIVARLKVEDVLRLFYIGYFQKEFPKGLTRMKTIVSFMPFKPREEVVYCYVEIKGSSYGKPGRHGFVGETIMLSVQILDGRFVHSIDCSHDLAKFIPAKQQPIEVNIWGMDFDPCQERDLKIIRTVRSLPPSTYLAYEDNEYEPKFEFVKRFNKVKKHAV